MTIRNSPLSTGPTHGLRITHPELVLDSARRLLKRLTHRRHEKQADKAPQRASPASPRPASEPTPKSRFRAVVIPQSLPAHHTTQTNPFEDDYLDPKTAGEPDGLRLPPSSKKRRAPPPPSSTATPRAVAGLDLGIQDRPKRPPRPKRAALHAEAQKRLLPPASTAAEVSQATAVEADAFKDNEVRTRRLQELADAPPISGRGIKDRLAAAVPAPLRRAWRAIDAAVHRLIDRLRPRTTPPQA